MKIFSHVIKKSGNEKIVDVVFSTTTQDDRSRDMQSKFARVLSAKLLSDKGLENIEITNGNMGEPVFPQSYVGSISHTAKSDVVAAAACLARSLDFVSIGIDLEQKQRKMSDNLQNELLLCCKTEMTKKYFLEDKNGPLLLCCLEAAYKSICPVLKSKPEFRNISIAINAENLEFSFEKIAGRLDVLNIDPDYYVVLAYISAEV